MLQFSFLLCQTLYLRVTRYDIGIISTIYVAPGFKKALDHPSSSELGLITAIYYAGTWFARVDLRSI